MRQKTLSKVKCKKHTKAALKHLTVLEEHYIQTLSGKMVDDNSEAKAISKEYDFIIKIVSIINTLKEKEGRNETHTTR